MSTAVDTRPFPPMPCVEHRFADAGAIRMHYVEAAPDRDEVAVLLHGWPQHHFMWRRVIPHLVDRYRVIAPDLRGFGWTDAPDSSYAKRELAEDVLALLDALELERVHLVGHDWGGWAAFLAAIDAPDRFSFLTALGITHPWAPAAPRPQDLWNLAYQPVVGAPVLGPLLQRRTPLIDAVFGVSGGERIWSEEERRSFRDQFREPARAEAASRIYRTFLTREVAARDPAGRLTVPAQLIVGRDDPVIHPGRLAGYEGHADAMTVEVVDGGHWLPEELPQLVADRILAA